MIFCPKCSSILSDNAVFCINCGYKFTGKNDLTEVSESNVNSNSNTNSNNYHDESPVFSNDPGDLVMQSASALGNDNYPDTGANYSNANQNCIDHDDAVEEDADMYLSDEVANDVSIGDEVGMLSDDCEDYEDIYHEEESKASRKKLVIILSVTIGVIVIALVVLILLLTKKNSGGEEGNQTSLISSEPSQKSDADPSNDNEKSSPKMKTLISSQGQVYFANGSMYYHDFESEENILLSDIYVSADDADKYYNEDIYVTSDSEYIYYIEDKYFEEINGSLLTYVGRLCRRSLEDNDEDVLSIADDVATYMVFEDKNIVVYETSDSIYEYDIKDGTSDFVANKKDIEYLGDDDYGYLTPDGKAYYKEAGKNEIFIDSDVTTICGDSKAFYYEKEFEVEFPYRDFVEYDIELMETEPCKPVEPARPYYTDYSSEDEYDKAYEEFEKLSDEYDKAYDEYLGLYEEYCNQRVMRDNKEIIESGEYSATLYDIYSVKGGVSKKIASNASCILSYDESGLFFSVFDFDLTEKLKLTQIVDANEDIVDFANDVRVSKGYILSNGNGFIIDNDKEVLDVRVSKDGKKIAFSVYDCDNEVVDIYSADFDGKKVSGTKFMCSNAENVWISAYNDVVCCVRNDDDSFSNYVNGIEYNANAYFSVSVSPRGEVAYAIGDYYDMSLYVSKDGKRNTEIDSGEIQDIFYDNDGTLIYTKRNGGKNQLCIYANGKNVIAADDYTDYVKFHEDSKHNDFMFIDDGILYKVKNGKPVKICENASAIIDSSAILF